MIDIREAATRKIGPLPAWAWGVVVGGGLLVYGLVSGKGASSPFQQTLASSGDGFDYGAGGGASGGASGGGGSIDGGSPNGGTVTPTTPTTPTSPVTHTPSGPISTTPSVGGRRNGTLAPSPTTTPVTPLVQSTQRTRSSIGDTDPNPLPLGLPFPRWDAIAATQRQAAETFLSLPPEAPSSPIPVPGSVTYPTLPPIIRAQGDTRKIDPRGWATATRARARAGIIPTTARRPVTLPPMARDALGRIRPRRNG